MVKIEWQTRMGRCQIVEATVNGRRFSARFAADGRALSVHRVYGRQHLLGGQYRTVYDEFRSVARSNPTFDKVATLIKEAI